MYPKWKRGYIVGEMSEANFLLILYIRLNTLIIKYLRNTRSTYFPLVSALGGIRNILILGGVNIPCILIIVT